MDYDNPVRISQIMKDGEVTTKKFKFGPYGYRQALEAWDQVERQVRCGNVLVALFFQGGQLMKTAGEVAVPMVDLAA